MFLSFAYVFVSFITHSFYHKNNIVETDFKVIQFHFNRAWLLLVLGLTQAESSSRYLAMCSLKIAIPTINDTLLDNITRQVL